MTSYPTREEVLASIVPKSDQLNADDLVAGPITTTITKVRSGDREQPIVIEIDGHRPYKPCKTMRRVLIATFGNDAKDWIGQRMTLFCDPEVMWGGVKVGGIRISHLSSLDQPRTFLLTVARGKRAEVTIYPLPTLSEEESQLVESSKRDIAAAETIDDLNQYGKIIAKLSKPVQDALRGEYKARLDQLKKPTEEPHGEATG
jgi:hypothetical protein